MNKLCVVLWLALMLAAQALSQAKPENEKIFEKEILDAVKKAEMARKIRLKSTFFENGVATHHGTYEFVAPNRYHKAIRVEKSGFEAEAIELGKQVYEKENGIWFKTRQPIIRVSEEFSLIRLAVLEIKDSIKDKSTKTVALPDETIAGRVLKVYQNLYPNKDNKPSRKVWISKNEGLLMRTEYSLLIGDKKNQMITDFDYDNKINIQIPRSAGR